MILFFVARVNFFRRRGLTNGAERCIITIERTKEIRK